MSCAPPWPTVLRDPPRPAPTPNRRAPPVASDPSLAALSDTLFTVAVGVYSLALIAFCAQLAFGRRPTRELVAAGSAEPPAAEAPVPGQEPEPVRRWGIVALALTMLGAAAHAGVLV